MINILFTYSETKTKLEEVWLLKGLEESGVKLPKPQRFSRIFLAIDCTVRPQKTSKEGYTQHPNIIPKKKQPHKKLKKFKGKKPYCKSFKYCEAIPGKVNSHGTSTMSSSKKFTLYKMLSMIYILGLSSFTSKVNLNINIKHFIQWI